jgi:hypothetical protein
LTLSLGGSSVGQDRQDKKQGKSLVAFHRGTRQVSARRAYHGRINSVL